MRRGKGREKDAYGQDERCARARGESEDAESLGEHLRRLVEELEVDEVERLDGVTLFDHAGDAVEATGQRVHNERQLDDIAGAENIEHIERETALT